MPGISQTPSVQKVATTSSVRPSSSAWAYTARAARTPSATSAKFVCVLIRPPCRTTSLPSARSASASEAEIHDGLLEGVHVDRPQPREQRFVGKSGEESVHHPLEVRDASLDPLGETEVFEA